MLGVLVDVDEARILDREQIDLKGIDLTDRFLPALFFHRNVILGLVPKLLEVEIESGPVEFPVAHQVAGKERPPVNADVEFGKNRDRRLGVGLLGDLQTPERNGKSDGVEIEPRQLHPVSLERLVRPFDNHPLQRLVDKKGCDKEQKKQADDDAAKPENGFGKSDQKEFEFRGDFRRAVVRHRAVSAVCRGLKVTSFYPPGAGECRRRLRRHSPTPEC